MNRSKAHMPVFYGCIFLLFISCSSPLTWSPYPLDSWNSLTSSGWQQDLDALITTLSTRHPNPWTVVSRAEFQDNLDALVDLAQELESQGNGGFTYQAQLITGLTRNLAELQDGHTSVNMYSPIIFPLITAWFPRISSQNSRNQDLDKPENWELRIVRIHRDYSHLLGARVIGIGGTTLDEFLESKLNSLIPADIPGHQAYRPQHSNILSNPYLMAGLGLADFQPTTGAMLFLEVETLGIEQDPGTTTTAEIPTILRGDFHSAVWETARLGVPDDWDLPIGGYSGDRWSAEAAPGILYIQYNSSDLNAMGFFQDAIQLLTDGLYTRLILDLRNNGGGNSVAGTWFAKQLGGLNIPPENLVTLVGPYTFSSGMWMAVDMMHHTSSRFAGLPIQTKPDHFGEVARFALPNSGIIIGHSTKQWHYSRGKKLTLDESGRIRPSPGLEGVSTFEEWTQGIDGAYRKAMAYLGIGEW